ncbi:MAG TPA: hypothetical protein VJA20_00820 [Candidatus Nanoarchaeia archaeon]|nr:hypothetical protein [Candidatus Nanoarchaeia archaeon]
MYDYKYLFKEIKKDEMKNVETHLNVKYRFDKEIAQINKKEIKKRINSSLIEYLRKKEGFLLTKNHYNHLLYFEDHKNFSRYLRIEKSFLKLGFDISVDSYLKISLEEMLHLDALDNFILTGNIDI